MTGSQVRRFRADLYRSARFLGDLKAASQGPKALAKREGRRYVYRKTGKLGRSICKTLGL